MKKIRRVNTVKLIRVSKRQNDDNFHALSPAEEGRKNQFLYTNEGLPESMNKVRRPSISEKFGGKYVLPVQSV